MLELAIQDKKRSVTVGEIAEKQDMSQSYIEQLFSRLNRNGMIKGKRGRGGGYVLVKRPEEISIAEIISAVDEKATQEKEVEQDSNASASVSGTVLWHHLSDQIYDYLSHISLYECMDIYRKGLLASTLNVKNPSSSHSSVAA